MRTWLVLLLALAGGAWTMPAQAFGECEAPGYVAAFDRTGLPNNQCYEIARVPITWAGGRTEMRLLGVVGEHPFNNVDALRTAFADLGHRVGQSMDAMEHLRAEQISILLTRIPDPDHDTDDPTSAFADTFSKHGECFVTHYWPAEHASRNWFMFLLSHEVFHCITNATVFHATERDRSASTNWWMEGTAEYFANLAYPGTEYSDQFIAEFDARSGQAPLWEFDYPSVFFFFWLSQQEDPRAVSRFIRNIASSSGGQHADLRRVVSAVAWKRFGEDYLDREIRQPGGRQVPVSPRPGRRVAIGGAAAPVVSTRPFVLHRERWRFERGKVYTVRQRDIDPGVSVGFSRAASKWLPPPDTVLACDEAVEFRVLATTTDAAGSARYEVRPRPGMESASACCLVGEWLPTDESRGGELRTLGEIGAPPLAGEGATLQCDAPMGGWTLRFGADGRGEVDWQGFGQHCWVTKEGVSLHTSSVRNGRKTFEWSSRVEGAAMIRHLDNDMSMHLRQWAGNLTFMDRTFPDPGPSIPEYGIAVHCLRDDLRVEGLDGLGHQSEIYRRAPRVDAPDADAPADGQAEAPAE